MIKDISGLGSLGSTVVVISNIRADDIGRTKLTLMMEKNNPSNVQLLLALRKEPFIDRWGFTRQHYTKLVVHTYSTSVSEGLA